MATAGSAMEVRVWVAEEEDVVHSATSVICRAAKMTASVYGKSA